MTIGNTDRLEGTLTIKRIPGKLMLKFPKAKVLEFKRGDEQSKPVSAPVMQTEPQAEPALMAANEQQGNNALTMQAVLKFIREDRDCRFYAVMRRGKLRVWRTPPHHKGFPPADAAVLIGECGGEGGAQMRAKIAAENKKRWEAETKEQVKIE